VVKLLVGLLKGAVIGAAIGYGAHAANLDLVWLACGLTGMFVGLLVGRPIWSLARDKNATSWIGVIKAAFGFGVGVGLWALVAKAWSPSPMMVDGYNVLGWAPSLAGAIGAVYGGFVELDDSMDDKAADGKKAAAKKSK
jgi:hypothetical protein